MFARVFRGSKSVISSINLFLSPSRLQHRRGVMKGMKAMGADAYTTVAQSLKVKPEVVKKAVQGIFKLAGKQMKKTGSFQLADMFILEMKDVPEQCVGIRPHRYLKDVRMLKFRWAYKTVKVTPTKKMLERVV